MPTILLILAVLIAASIAIPLLFTLFVHPSIGFAIAFVASGIWLRLIRPAGDAFTRAIAMTGLAGVLCVLVTSLVMWIRR